MWCENRSEVHHSDAATARTPWQRRITEVSRGIDKWLWFVEAHSQAEK
jgi:hypothetical protein